MVKSSVAVSAYQVPNGKPATVANIDLDPMFTPEIMSKVEKLLETGISSGEKIGVWEQVRDECLAAGIAWDVAVLSGV